MSELYKSILSVAGGTAQHEERVIIPKGATLVKPGVVPKHVIIIERGLVEIELKAERGSVVYIAGQGKVLGLYPIMAGMPEQVRVKTIEECAIMRIPALVFLMVLKQYPSLSFPVAKVLSQDLRTVERLLCQARAYCNTNAGSNERRNRDRRYRLHRAVVGLGGSRSWEENPDSGISPRAFPTIGPERTTSGKLKVKGGRDS